MIADVNIIADVDHAHSRYSQTASRFLKSPRPDKCMALTREEKRV
jgi:hypothetical protein